MIDKKNSHSLFGILILTLFLNLIPQKNYAQNEIQDSLVVERLEFIKSTLKQDKTNTRRWWNGWLVAYSAATIGQGVVYFTSDELGTRQDMALGAATTLLGAAGQFISPLIPGKELEKLEVLPENSDDERLKKLAVAEKLLNDVALREKLARSWKTHALSGAVNLSSGLITWLGFKRDIWAGVGNFVLNTVITETQIWTQPTLAKRRYANYYKKYLNSENSSSCIPRVNYYFKAYAGGFGFKIVF